MEHPIFTFITINKASNRRIAKQLLRAWSCERKNCKTDTLPNIVNYVKSNNCSGSALYRCTAGYRARVSSDDYKNNYNNVVLVDFDYKNLYKKYVNIPPIELYRYMLTKLVNNKSFYYFENSITPSKETNELVSAHFLFYFDTDILNEYETYFNYCARVLTESLPPEFDTTHLGDCIDKCANDAAHLMFSLADNYYFNKFCTGEERPSEEDKPKEKSVKQANTHIYNNSKWNATYLPSLANKTHTHLRHNSRWKIYMHLAYFLSSEKLQDAWDRIIDNMEPGKHSNEFYKYQPIQEKWLESKLNSIDTKCLFKYGYCLTPKTNSNENV